MTKTVFYRANSKPGLFSFMTLWIIATFELCSLADVDTRLLASWTSELQTFGPPAFEQGHLHVPRRSSRKPICSLRESMRSSCWKEWDSKVVFSDQPSSRERGKKLLKGVKTSCSFCSRRKKKNCSKKKKQQDKTKQHVGILLPHFCGTRVCVHKTVSIWH